MVGNPAVQFRIILCCKPTLVPGDARISTHVAPTAAPPAGQRSPGRSNMRFYYAAAATLALSAVFGAGYLFKAIDRRYKD